VSVGVLLACLTVSSKSWANSDVAWAIISESLDRNVFWLLKNKHMPTLRDLEKLAGREGAVDLPGGYQLSDSGERSFLADWWKHSLTSE
jgi:hypothetical protein